MLSPEVLQGAEQRVLDSSGQFLTQGERSGSAANQQRREIVFVDARVPDANRFVDDLTSQANRAFEIVWLNQGEDGVAQVSRALHSQRDIAAVHLISHGADGQVQLGASTLDFDALRENAQQIKAWGDALTEQADILIYGCDVAATPGGEAMLSALSRLTGADVAASTDRTGNAALGGDWALEYATGAVEAQVALDSASQHTWNGVLAITANGAATSSQATNVTSLTWAHTVNSGSNSALFVTLAIDGLGAGVTGVTFDGVALTQVGRTAGNHAVEIWRLVNPNVTTANVVVNLGATTTIKGGAITYDGVNQSTPTGTYGSANGTSTSASVIVTSATGELVLDITNWTANPAGYTTGAGQTAVWNLTNATHRGVSTTEAGAATVTMSSTVSSSQQWEIGAVSIRAASNNAPVLDTTKNPALSAINEDAGTPSGAVGSLVSSLVDFASPAGQVDNITDADSGALLGIAVTAADTSNGAWWYSTNGGTNWNALGTVSNTSARLLAADANTRIYFQPTPNFAGSIANAITFRAWDRTSGVNGTTTDLTSAETALDQFNSVAYANNNGTVNWASAWQELGESDGTGAGMVVVNAFAGLPTNSLQIETDFLSRGISRQIDLSTASAATLSLDYIREHGGGTNGVVSLDIFNGTSWTTLRTFSINATDATAQAYSVDISAYANANTQLRFIVTGSDLSGRLHVDNVQVSYTGLNTGGGTAFSSSSDAASLTVAAVNDPPVNTVPSNRYTALNTAVSFSTTGGNAIQIADVDAASSAVRVSLAATNGTLTLASTAGLTLVSGANGSAAFTYSGSVSAFNTALGNGVTFTPTTGYRGLAQLTLTTDDQGNTGSGGALSDTDIINVHVGALVVTNTSDSSNGAVTSIANLVASDGGDGVSLREAIQATNATANVGGPDYIYFNIAGAGPHVINLSSALPAITGAVVLDATTDDSWAANGNLPAIELNGTAAGAGAVGLNLTSGASSSTIRGLAINRFSSHGILLDGADNVTIAGNHIGVGTSGLTDLGNSANGIQLNNGAQNNIIGGLVAADRNVISGNDNAGIAIDTSTSTGNQVIGNYIGVGADGSTSLGNAHDGVHFNTAGTGNTVGSALAGGRNVISANGIHGIGVGDTSGVIIIGNYIGTDYSGSVAKGNAGAGVQFASALTVTSGTVGGTNAGEGNLIAFNAGDGVYVKDATIAGVQILGNSISRNSGLGIDLSPNGVTANDAGDSDAGANNLQNFPVLTSAASASAGTTVVGTLNSNANTTYRIEFFGTRSAAADATNGEGERYLGFLNITTDGSGNASFNTLLVNAWVNHGDKVTATATVDLGGGNYGSTSEFAANVTAAATGIVVVDTVSDAYDSGVASGTVTISTLGNSRGTDGRISLREAIYAANNTANGGTPDKIVFAIDGIGPHIINLSAALPAIAQAVVIDASSEPDYAGAPVVVLNGGGTVQDGVRLYSGSDGSTIRGLVVQNFTQIGIHINSSDGNTIAGNWIGLNAAGTGSAGNATGVLIWNSNNNVVGGSAPADRNVISGNTSVGVGVDTGNGTSTGNKIQGNYIGTNATGTSSVGNGVQGVWVNAASTTIGGTAAGQGNVISGTTTWVGVQLEAPANNTLIAGNIIGLNASGTAALSNAAGGIYISSANNTIGGITSVARNIISGNGGTGITFTGASATGNVVIGNYIGTDITGTLDVNGIAAVGGMSGVVMDIGASNNRIGTNADGTNDAAERNIISGNNWYGVEMLGAGTSNNVVQGNYIGTDVTGLVALGNSEGGVSFWNGATNNRLGSGVTGARNIISGNHHGVLVANGVSNNRVQGNYIGIGADGTTQIGNSAYGVLFNSGGTTSLVTGNIVGTDADGSNDAGERNVISGNLIGIDLEDAEVSGNTISGNYIGTDATGLLDRGNQLDGILIQAGAHNNTIGGTSAVQRNVISGNGQDGVRIIDAGSSSNVVSGNYIGVNANGNAALANDEIGVHVLNGASSNIIGGTSAGARNVISGNTAYGVDIQDATTANNTIEGNYIGVDTTGSFAISNGGFGIVVDFGATGTTIGGAALGAGNVISGNTNVSWSVARGGIYLSPGGITTIQGNTIGLDASRTVSLGNGSNAVARSAGIYIASASGLNIGGTAANAGNVIAGNFGYGIMTDGGGGDFTALSNSIYGNTRLGIDLGGNGVTANDVGDADPGENNLQNFPVLTNVVTNGSQVTVSGFLNSTANTDFRIELFASPSADASGYGEGQRFLGAFTVNTGAGGTVNFTNAIPVSVLASEVITATATEDQGGGNFVSTSEISAALAPTSAGINVVPVPVAAGGETRVNTFTAGAQATFGTQSVAMDANGNYVVVWQSLNQDAAGNYGVYAQRYNASGVAQGAEFVVNTTTADQQGSPSVAMDSSGNFVVVWQSNLQDGSGLGVYGRRYDNTGSALSGEFLINQTTANNQYAPSLAMNASGAFVVTWTSVSQDGGGDGVYARRYNASGAALGNEFLVNQTTALNQNNASVAVDASGGFVVVWASDNAAQDGSGSAVLLRRYDSAGSALSGETLVATTSAGDQARPRIDMDGSGNFVVVWESNLQDGSGRGIYARCFNAAGLPLTAEVQVNQYTNSDQYNANVAADANGNFVVTWTSTGQDGSFDGVYARRFAGSGIALDSEFKVTNSSIGNQNYSSAVLDSSGRMVIAWSGVGASDGNSDGVFLQRYSFNRMLEASGSAQVQIVLNTAPTADVTIALSSSDTSEGTVSAPSVTFTAANWNVPQTVTISAVDDTLIDGDMTYSIVTAAATSTDSNYSGFNPADVSITNVDTDTASILVSPPLLGSEFRVNTATANEQNHDLSTSRSIAADGFGNYVVVWASQGQDGSGWGVYAQRFNAAGVAQGGEILVNATTVGDQAYPAVAMSSNGSFVVVWKGPDADQGGIYAQRFNSAGVAQGAELQVNQTWTGDQENPNVAIDGVGNFVVTWSNPSTATGYDIYARRFDAAGNILSSEFFVNSTTADAQNTAQIAMNASGAFVVTWQSYAQDGSDYGIYAQRYDAAGVPQGAEFRVNTTTANRQWAAPVAMDGAGNFVVAWVSDYQDGGLGGIYAQRFNDSGLAQGGEFRVNTTTADNQSSPNIAMKTDGEFVVVWASQGQDGALQGSYGQRYSAAGAALGGEFRINTTTAGEQADPDVAMAPNGDFMVVWRGNGSGDADGIFAQRFAGTTRTTEAGGTTTFSIVLNSQPSANVTVNLTSSDITEGSVIGSVTFTTLNWNIPQLVTVTGVDDATADGNINYSIVTAAASSTDGNYSGVNAVDIAVTNIDNDGPVNLMPGAQSTNEDNALVFSTANGNAITVSYAAIANARLQVALASTNGTLTLSQLTGLTIVSGANGSSAIVIDGAQSDINDALNGMVFQPSGNYNGAASVQVTTSLSADLQGLYTFNAGNANDNSAGTAQIGAFVGNATTVVDGTRGTVLSLDGAGDSVQIPSVYGSPTNITIGGWVNLISASTRSDFISLNDRVHIALDDFGNGVKGSLQTGAATWDDLPSGQQIAGTGWHHVMYSYDDTNNVHSLYIDGVLVASEATTGSIYWTGATTTYIGQHPSSGWYLNGRVDDVRIYNRALSAAEIASIASDQYTHTDNVAVTINAINDAPAIRQAGANVLTNGSFETNNVPSGTNNSGIGVTVAGWTAIGGEGFEVWNNTPWLYAASNGASLLELDVTGGVNGISQNVSTVAGQNHVLTFDFTNRPNLASSAVEVYWRGNLISTITQNAVGWQTYTFSVTGSGGADELKFMETGLNDTSGNLLDNVSLTPVPIAAYTENAAAVVLNPGMQVFDTELSATNNFAGSTMTLARNGGANAQDAFSASGTLSALTQGGALVVGGTTIGSVTTNSGGTLLLTFNANATNALVDSALQQIAYSNSSDAPPASVQLDWTLNDGNAGAQGSGGALQVFGSTTVNITALSDAPVNAVPGPQSTNEDIALVFSPANGNSVAINDLDAVGDVEVTLSVTNGALTLGGTTGLVFLAGDGISDAAMTVRGTVADVNAALNGMSFVPAANFSGGASLTVATKDSTLVSLDIDANLQARYTFEGNANDVAAGPQQNGTLQSGAAIVTDPTRGQVLSLDGVNDYVELSAHTASVAALTQGTISGWIKATGTFQTVFSISDTADTGSYASLFLGASGYLTYEVVENGVLQLAVYRNSAAINDGNWHHVAVTIGASGNQLFVDGQVATSAQLTYDVGTSSTQKFLSNVSGLDSMAIGRNQDSSGGKWYTAGALEDVRLYSRALSATEVAALSSDLNLTDSDTVSITVNPVNDQPSFNNLDGTPNYTENGAAIALDNNVTITDFELGAANNFNGATLTLARNGGANTEDVFAASGTLSALTQGGALVVGGTTIGTVTTNSAGTLLLTFNASATNALVNSAMQQIAYSNISDTPLANVQINWTFNDGNAGSQGSGGALQASGSTTVAIAAVNDPPSLFASASVTVLEDGSYIFGAGAITLNDADAALAPVQLTITATQGTFSLSGTAGLTFSTGDGSNDAVMSFTGTLSAIGAALTNSVYTPTANYSGAASLQLDASDLGNTGAGGTLTASRTIAITVTPQNDAPVITSDGGGASASVSIAENTTAVTTVTTTDVDLPAQTLTYSIVGGADAAIFSINASTGALSFLVAPNYEVPTDSGTNNVYDVTVQVSDGNGGADTQAISVTITPVNDNAPVITSNGGGASASVNVAENSTAVSNVSATDADLPAQSLTYSIVGGADAAQFTINASTGALSFLVAPNYEAPTDSGVDNVYDVTVQVSDGTLTDSQAIAVTITPVNDNTPVITSNGGGATANVNVAENSTAVSTVTASDADLPAQSLSYSIIGGADAANFSINTSTGALSFLVAPDYETPADTGADNVYDVIVQVSDGTLVDSQAIAVTVTPVNDNTPVITSNGGGASASVSAAENTTAVTTVTATDADLPAQSLTYSIIGGADAAQFTIDGVTGALSFLVAPSYESPTDAGADNVYDVTVQVSDGTFTDAQAIAVTVTPVNDNAPVITSNGGGASASVNVAENAAAVTTVSATDADLPAQTLTYSISGGADAALFTIDAATGVLSFLATPNYEAPADAGVNNVYDVTVQVSDGAFTDTQAIAVSVMPVNDNTPAITSDGGGNSASVNVAENSTAVTTVGATDADLPAQTLTYSIIGGADAARFSIDANTGALSFVAAPDFEAPADAGANNVYDVTVQVSDGTFTDSQAIAVTVTPVNDHNPLVTSDGGGATASVNVAENSAAVTTVTATDADQPVQTLSFSITGGADAALFSIDASTGVLVFNTAPDFEAPGDANSDGVYEVSVQVADGNGGFDTQALSVTITNVNEAPVNTLPGAQTGNEDAALPIAGVAVNDVDANLSSVQVSVSNGTLTVDLSGGATISAGANASASLTLAGSQAQINAALASIAYVGALNFNGSDTLTVVSTDASGLTDSDALAITLNPINDTPTLANPIADQAATEDAAFSFQFPINTFDDVDVGDALTYSAAGVPSWLSFDAATRTFTGTPANADIGTHTITVRATDASGAFVEDTFDLVVGNTNDAPTVANPIADQNATEDAAFNFQVPVNTFDDVDVGDSLTYTASGVPAWLSFNAATRTFAGTPANADVGTHPITVRATDVSGAFVEDTFDLVVANTNDAPTIANPIANQNATEDVSFSFQFAANTFNDVDVGDVLTYAASGVPAWLSFDAATRTFTGTPANADVGTHSITVRATDASGAFVEDTFDLVVANTNDAPTIANPISDQVTAEDAPFSFQFAVNAFSDVDVGDSLTYTASGVPGWLSFDATTRTFSGTPANGDVGGYTITLRATDMAGAFVEDQFDIVVTNTNDAPTLANSIADQAAVEDAPFSFQFAANTFADVDAGDSLTYSASGVPSWLVFDAFTRTFSGTPANADVGTYTLTVRATDLAGAFAEDQFDIVVANTNDVPTVANPIVNQAATEDAPFSFQFAANTFADVDAGDNLTYTASSVPAWLTFNSATRTFSGTPLNADVGTFAITVRATDLSGAFVDDTFDVVVGNTNDAPTVANAIPNQNATEDVSFSFQFAANTFDEVDVGDSLTYTASGVPTWLSFNAATRTFSGTPLNADVGTHSITVRATDLSGAFVENVFDIVVANTNDAPTVANAIPNQNAIEDAAFAFQFAANAFADVDAGDSLTYTASGVPAWLSFNAATRTFSGTAANADVGTVSITVRATDLAGAFVEDTFDIVVANTNDAPTLVNAIANQVATEDAAFTFQFASNTFADVDIGDSLTYTASGVPAWLTFNAATRTFSGTPANADVGTHTLTVRATDSNGAFVEDQFDIVVANTNDVPIAGNNAYSIDEDALLNVPVGGILLDDIDVDGDSLTAVLVSGPSHGRIDLNADGSFTYTPEQDFFGADAFSYRASDGTSVSNVATVSLSVSAVNDAPVIGSLPAQSLGQNTSVSMTGLAIHDVDSSSMVEVSLAVDHGSLQLASTVGISFVEGANGSARMHLRGALAEINAAISSLRYSPELNFVGRDQLRYWASDGQSVSITRHADIDVAASVGLPQVIPGPGAEVPQPAPIDPIAKEPLQPVSKPGESKLAEPTARAQDSEEALLELVNQRQGSGRSTVLEEVLRRVQRAEIVLRAVHLSPYEALLASLDWQPTTLSETELTSLSYEGRRLAAGWRIEQQRATQQDQGEGVAAPVLSVTAATGISLSVGAVLWALRAGGLAAALAASTPLWRHLDPLPILGRDDDEDAAIPLLPEQDEEELDLEEAAAANVFDHADVRKS